MSSTLPYTEHPSAGDTRRSEAIFSAIVFGAREFLSRTDSSDCLDPMLEHLGRATASDQVRVLRNDPPAANGEQRASLVAQWIAPGANAGSPMDELQNISYRDAGCARWEQLLSQGERIVGNRVDLPATERPILELQGVVSLAMVPIFAGARWWGFIGFSDCVRERVWTEAELDALSAAAGILGAAYARREMEERIAIALVHERLALEIAEVLTSPARSLDHILRLSSERIVRRLGVDLVRVWVRLDDDVLKSTSSASSYARQLQPATVRIGECAAGEIALRSQPRVWEDRLPELWPGSAAELDAAGLCACAGYPLVTGGRLVGVVMMLSREPIPPAKLEGLASVTDELALAIERSRAQNALHLSQDRYMRLVEATVEGICIHDGERLLDANPSIAHMFGFKSVEDCIGYNPLSFIHPDSLPDVKRRLAMNYLRPYETMMVRLDGTTFPAEIKGSDYMHDGRKLRVTAIRDITERKEAERMAQRLMEEQAAHRASEQTRRHAEFLVDASRILASSFDTTTTLTQLAHLAVRFLADFCVVTLYEDGAMRRLASVHGDSARQELLDEVVRLWQEEWQDDHPLSVAQRAGDPFIVPHVSDADLDRMAPDPEHRRLMGALGTRSLLSVPIAGGGQLIGSMMFSRGGDTPYGEEQLALAQELGRRAAVAILSARSYQAAEAATRARDDMLAVVAHDLRNPLNTIVMGSTVALELTEAAPDTPARRQFEIIRRSAEHMNRLIQDLLDATRLQSGQLRLERLPSRVGAIVAEAVEILHPLATHAGIGLTVDIEPELPPLNADRIRIQQVLSNLVGNALKFTPKGGCITISVAAAGNDVRFCVRDTGQGIPADQLPHIFGRFWQARRTDRRGLGLGLSIAKGIVEAHGGTIWVESQPGSGSSFLFTIPCDLTSHHTGIPSRR